MTPILKKILKSIYPLLPTVSLRICILRCCGYLVGKEVYIPSSLRISDLKNRHGNVTIGDRVSIGPNVTIITDSSPNNSILIKIFPLRSENVVIENDAWIGAGVTILPGVTIGECSVIGAGSVLNRSIPPFSIVAGIPGKVIRTIDKYELQPHSQV